VEIVRADLEDAAHRNGVLEVLSSYAEDPMGGGQPLAESVRAGVIDGLREHPTTEILLALSDDRPVGIAICFVGFTTFRASRLLNIHDLAVVPECRGRGIGRRLLRAAEARARELGCCKLTLEVLERNARARGLYASFGFGQVAPGEEQSPTFFLEKPIGTGAGEGEGEG
jgi:ribosomal protein S18 acetylase RimI-like enzyme